METNEVVERSFILLGRILDDSAKAKDDGNMQVSHVHRHADNIFHLGQDTICLLQAGRSHAAPIAVRAMLESLFKLVAATKQRDNAVEIAISELEDDCARIKKWLDPAIYAPVAEDVAKAALNLRKEHKINSNKKWNTFACAEAAELELCYREGYYHLSAHAHATVMGIGIQEVCPSVGYVLQILIFAVLSASAHSLPVFLPQSRETYARECLQLGDEWMRLMDNGVFAKMDELED